METKSNSQQHPLQSESSPSYYDQTAGLPRGHTSFRSSVSQGQHAQMHTLQNAESSITLPSEVLALLQQTMQQPTQRRAQTRQVIANEPFQQIAGAFSALPAQAVATPPIQQLLSYLVSPFTYIIMSLTDL